MPLGLQASISRALAAGADGFAPRLVEGGFVVSGGGLTAQIGRGAAVVAWSGGLVRFEDVGVGARGRLVRVRFARARVRGDRVVLPSAGVRAWYAAGPLGVEQGFVVARRPVGVRADLVVGLRLGGGLRPAMAGGAVGFVGGRGRLVARYGGVSAVDARGRSLRARISLVGRRLSLVVGVRGVVFPVRIDPLIEQQKIARPQDEMGASNLGDSVALSADGNTALIGGQVDDGLAGAAWVFTRSGMTWSEQHKLLAPFDTSGSLAFGESVALSADGNTALIGGYENGDGGAGAAWVFTRSGTTWSEQQKIPAPMDRSGLPDFGVSVALSADGNTAVIGGPSDSSSAGAAWVYTRSAAAWIEQQKILTPTDETSGSNFGFSVALSADGTTALIGGMTDGGLFGAAWVYTLVEGAWIEQQKITAPADEKGRAQFGVSVALSADGNTALIGSSLDNGGAGAAWAYTRAGSAWTEQQKIPAPADASGAGFGDRVALSADGNTALIGGYGDNSGAGAAWVFVRAGTTWAEQQKIPVPQDAIGVPYLGSSVALSADGSTALIGANQDNSGAGAAWVFVPASPAVTTPGVPVTVSPPVIIGTPTAGQRLKCSPGGWTNSPTSYTYAWSLNGTPIHGATSYTYTVLAIDRGSTLKCTVIARDAAGAGAPASSAGVKVPARAAKRCPVSSGAITGTRIGAVKLGITRGQARRAFPHSSDRGKRYEDFFCLIPIGTRVGYASPRLLASLPATQRRALAGRVVWISTSNPIYALRGIRAGATLAAAQAAIHFEAPLVIGRNTWYLGRTGPVTAVLKVRHGLVEEVGIASSSLTRTAAARGTLMRSFR